jgi:hypothetical protein
MKGTWWGARLALPSQRVRVIEAPGRAAAPPEPPTSVVTPEAAPVSPVPLVEPEAAPATEPMPEEPTSHDLVMAAMAAGIARGVPERQLRSRLGTLVERNRAAITRVINYGAELKPEARQRLQAHLDDPVRYPLPEAQKTGRPYKVPPPVDEPKNESS